MFALQTTPPHVGPAAVVLVAFLVAGAALGALGSAVVRRLSNPVGTYRLLYAGVLLPFALLAYGVLALLGFGPAIAAALGPGAPFDAVVADVTAFLAAGAVFLAAYAPTVRGVRAVRDIDLSTGRSLARMTRYVVGVSVVVTVVLAPLRLLPSGGSPLAVAAALAALVVAATLASPWVVPVLRATNEPTGEPTDRLTTLRSRAGLDVRDALVLDTDDEETATALVRGPPGYRRLFVTSTFLDRFGDEVATALLAIRAGRLRSHLLVIRLVTVVVGGLLLVASVTGAGPRWPLLGASAGVLVVGFASSRRGVRAADDHAAERVGADAVADALERYAAVHAMEPSRRRAPNPLSANVALGDRIDRLRERAGE